MARVEEFKNKFSWIIFWVVFRKPNFAAQNNRLIILSPLLYLEIRNATLLLSDMSSIRPAVYSKE